MGLLEDMMVKCQLYTLEITEDGYGGYTQHYKEGVLFDAVVNMDTSIQAEIAKKQGVTAVYTVVTSKSLPLQYHQVFKRLEDGKVFRVTSDGTDSKTPEMSNLDMCEVSAEEWNFPAGAA